MTGALYIDASKAVELRPHAYSIFHLMLSDVRDVRADRADESVVPPAPSSFELYCTRAHTNPQIQQKCSSSVVYL